MLVAEVFSLPQVPHCCVEFVPVTVDDGPVGQDPLDPDMIACPAKHRQRPAETGQCLLGPAVERQDCAALRLGACALDAVEVQHRGVDFTERLS